MRGPNSAKPFFHSIVSTVPKIMTNLALGNVFVCGTVLLSTVPYLFVN